jgi:hypothetical protein
MTALTFHAAFACPMGRGWEVVPNSSGNPMPRTTVSFLPQVRS